MPGWRSQSGGELARLRRDVLRFDPGTPSSAALQTFRVESLDAETTSRESGAQARAYTAPTWPANVARNAPVRPCQNLIFLSKEAEANFRASGENRIELTGCWWPVRRALGFVFAAPAFREVQKSNVASSEPLTNLSQVA